MRKICLLVTVFSFSIWFSGFAQTEVDALRYSFLQYNGTARFNAMGGAFGALGGEISGVMINPAGAGIYRSSEMSFSAALNNRFTDAKHYDQSASDYRLYMNVGNFGLAANYMTAGNWESGTFVIGFNRLSNFHDRIIVSGINPDNSLLDTYLTKVQNNSSDPFGADLAWDTYLIDSDTAGAVFSSAIQKYNQGQYRSIRKSGSMGETFMALGGNYNDRLYLGGSVGFPKVRYEEEIFHEETVSNSDTLSGLQSFTYNQYLQTTGAGVNFKMGMIYKITDYARIGAAIHSPTYFTLSDQWSSDITAVFDSVTNNAESPQGRYDYALTTPFRAIGSMAFVIGKMGLISAEYEMVDYSLARLRSRPSRGSNYSFSNENTAINDLYTTTNNLRLGGEIRLSPMSLRAGYSYYGNPFDNTSVNRFPTNVYSFGIGFRDTEFFFDATYKITKQSYSTYIYDASIVDATEINSLDHGFIFSLGFKF